MLGLLYDKCKPLITTVAYGSIFYKKKFKTIA